MKTYIFYVAQSVDHEFEIQADTLEQAWQKYSEATIDDLMKRRVHVSETWEHPWSVFEVGSENFDS